MRDFRIVFSVLLRQRLRTMFGAKAKSGGGRIAVTVLMIFSFAVLEAMWSTACFEMLRGLDTAGRAALGLFGVFLASMVMTLFFSIASVIGTLFSANDAELLAALPLRSGAVFFARFMFVYFGELAVSLFIALPAFVCYMLIAGGGVLSVLAGVAVLLLLPALPLAVATVLALLLMRSAVFMRHRETFMTVMGFLLGITLSLGGNIIGQMTGRMGLDGITSVMSGAGDVLAGASRVFPPAAWAAEAIAADGGTASALLHGLLYLAICTAALALTGIVGSRTYSRSVFASRETAKRGGRKARLSANSMTAKNPVLACMRRERYGLFRSPTYAMNCLLGAVIFPLMILLIPFMTKASAGENLGPELAGVGAMRLFAVMLGDVPARYVFAGALGIMLFATFANIAASTAISREGEGLERLKAMPLRMSTLCYGKLIVSAAANAVTVLLTAAVLTVLLPAYWVTMLAAAFAASVAGIGTAALGMLVDAVRPKLVWQNEAEAVKQNANGFFGMLLNLLIGVLVGGAGALAAVFWGMLPGVLAAVLTAAAGSAAGVWGLGRAADKAMI